MGVVRALHGYDCFIIIIDRFCKHISLFSTFVFLYVSVLSAVLANKRVSVGQLSLASLRGRLIEYQLWLG